MIHRALGLLCAVFMAVAPFAPNAEALDTTMPTLNGFSVSGSAATPGSTVSIDYNAFDDSGSLSCVIFQFTDPLGGTPQIRRDGTVPLSGTVTTTVPSNWPNGTYRLDGVTLCDPTGNHIRLLRNGSVVKYPSGATGPTTHTLNFAPGDVTVARPPSTPTSVSARPFSDLAATVSWSAPSGNGAPLQSYSIVASPGGNTVQVQGNQTSAVVEGLTAGTAYSFTVAAKNRAGDSAASIPSNEVVAGYVPDAPGSVQAVAADQSAAVSWAAAGGNGSPVTGYTVTTSPGGQTCTTTAALLCTVDGLTNGTVYTFTVKATNAIGDSPILTRPDTVTPAGVPAQPEAPAVTPNNDSAVVSWAAAGGNGSPITGYTVTTSPGGQTCTTTGALSCTVNGLTNGTVYTFTVKATNAIGDSLASVFSSLITPATVPDQPIAPTAAPGNSSATVSWAPTGGNGSPVTGYTVTTSPGGQTCTAADSLSCTVTGLANGTTYRFTVTAMNHLGDSPSSPASNAVVPTGPTGAPSTSPQQQPKTSSVPAGLQPGMSAAQAQASCASSGARKAVHLRGKALKRATKKMRPCGSACPYDAAADSRGTGCNLTNYRIQYPMRTCSQADSRGAASPSILRSAHIR